MLREIFNFAALLKLSKDNEFKKRRLITILLMGSIMSFG